MILEYYQGNFNVERSQGKEKYESNVGTLMLQFLC